MVKFYKITSQFSLWIIAGILFLQLLFILFATQYFPTDWLQKFIPVGMILAIVCGVASMVKLAFYTDQTDKPLSMINVRGDIIATIVSLTSQIVFICIAIAI